MLRWTRVGCGASRWSTLLAVLVGASTGSFWSEIALSGENDGARIRLSFEKDRNVATLDGAPEDLLILYCRVEGAPDLDGLGVQLRWNPRARRDCYEQVNPPQSLACGRVLVDREPGAFGGETYEHRIVFDESSSRDVFAFAFRVRGCSDPPPTTFYVQSASARDSNERLDALQIVGAAHVAGGRLLLPTYQPRDDLRTSLHWARWRAHQLSHGIKPRLSWPLGVRAHVNGVSGAEAVLQDHASELGVEWGNMRLAGRLESPHGQIFKWNQTHAGVPVHNGWASAQLSAGGKLLSIQASYYDVSGAASVASVARQDAIRAARNELGVDADAVRATLVVYPGDGPGREALAWKVDFPEWTIFVSARDERILAVAGVALQNEPAQIWVPHPMAALNDPGLRSTGPDDCQGTTYDNAYETVTLPPDLVYVGGVAQLESPRVLVLDNYPPANTPPTGSFIFPRCDLGKGFEHVMAFYVLDRAQSYVHNTLQIPMHADTTLQVDPVTTLAAYSPTVDTIWLRGTTLPAEDAEDAEVALHEYLHALHEDALACPNLQTKGGESKSVSEGLADFFAAALLAHEPVPFDGVWAEWVNQNAEGNLGSVAGRTVANRVAYPYGWHPVQHTAGHMTSGAMWDAFGVYESIFGSCPTGTGDTHFLASCAARDRLLSRLLLAFADICTAPSLRNLAESLVSQEMGEVSPNVPLIEGLVAALDARGLFFNQQEEPWGAVYEPVLLPADQSSPSVATVRLKITNAQLPVVPSSVVLRYGGTSGPFSGSASMAAIGNDTFEGTIPPFPLETLVRYRVEATNGLGVTTHWPKSVSPTGVGDAAVYYVGTSASRTIISHSVGSGPGQVIAAGASAAFDLDVSENGAITDVACHIALEGETAGLARIEVSNPQATAAVYYHESYPTLHLGSIRSYDWWFDQSRRAPYNQVVPFGYSSPNPADLGLLVGSGLAGTWTVTIANADTTNGPALTVLAVELQITTGALPVAVSDAGAVPQPVGLGACYPNPFFSRTSIPVSLATDTPVELKIYDATGRLVRTIRKDLTRGNHALAWNRRDSRGRIVPSGVYFYQVRTPSFAASKKMVVAR